jgi:ligand-binding sensor domain-containing protein
MARKFICFTAAVFLLFPVCSDKSNLLAQKFTPEFEHINIEHGLPHSTATSIVNDSYGYMWIGTEGGLARYDSRNFIVYRSDSLNNRLLANQVLMIHEDEDSVIWVGTRHSLELYLRDSDSFRHFRFFPDANNNE